MVYATIVLVANLRILHKTNTHTLMGSLIIFMSIFLFWILLYLENNSPKFPDVYHIFSDLFCKLNTWLILLFIGWFNYG